MQRNTISVIIGLWACTLICSCGPQPPAGETAAETEQGQDKKGKLQVLIIDGENNHGAWPKTTVMMKDYLEESGRFEVDVERTAYTWQGPHNDGSQGGEENRKKLLAQYPIESSKQTEMVEEPVPDPDFKPKFSDYDVVLTNFGWKASMWPEETRQNFESYVRNGGGLVVVHAANNSFGEWDAYNKMIGLGGWGGRDEKTGPYVYYNEAGDLIRDTSAGGAGGHGPQHEFTIRTRAAEHPIMEGLPAEWLHAQDELYDKLRGPAENMTVLATAFSAEEQKGTGRHEPMLMAIDYGEGRVFHTALGHTDYSQECVGFIITLLRGTEWAATEEVTLTEIPEDFPGKDAVSQRSWK